MGDVKEEFINDILINFKENESLRRKLADSIPGLQRLTEPKAVLEDQK